MNNHMKKIKNNEFLYYICDLLPVRHFFTTKFGGVSTGHVESLNLGFNRGDLKENVVENYHIVARELGVDFEKITVTRQVHSDEVAVVTEKEIGMGLSQPFTWNADAIVTNLPGVPIAGFYADCVVTLISDPVSQSIGVCHSGWRGTAKNILGKTVQKMVDNFGAKPENTIAVIGPSIGQCCFETDEDVPLDMKSQMGDVVLPFIETRGEKFHVDLQGINRMNLQKAGLRDGNIIDSGICTMCRQDEFWSHRATKGVRGVQAGFIVL